MNKFAVNRGIKCDKVFKNGPSEICGRKPLKNLKGYGLLKVYFHKFHLVHSWILWPKWHFNRPTLQIGASLNYCSLLLEAMAFRISTSTTNRLGWQTNGPSLSIGDLAILKNDNAPQNKWPLGRIIYMRPSNDNVTSVLKVLIEHGN